MYIWQASKWPQLTYQPSSIAASLKFVIGLQQQLISKVEPLDKATIKDAALFSENVITNEITLDDFERDSSVSSTSDKILTDLDYHQIPGKQQLHSEILSFIAWSNSRLQTTEECLIKAAITHLWLIAIQPFNKDSGRIIDSLTDRALAQANDRTFRFYSLTSAIQSNQDGYLSLLQDTLSCRTTNQLKEGQSLLDITDWIIWFVEILGIALQQGIARIERINHKTQFWYAHSQTVLTLRQINVLNQFLLGDNLALDEGLSANKYQAITGVSKATATRDLIALVAKGCIKKLPGGGRNTCYSV